MWVAELDVVQDVIARRVVCFVWYSQGIVVAR